MTLGIGNLVRIKKDEANNGCSFGWCPAMEQYIGKKAVIHNYFKLESERYSYKLRLPDQAEPIVYSWGIGNLEPIYNFNEIRAAYVPAQLGNPFAGPEYTFKIGAEPINGFELVSPNVTVTIDKRVEETPAKFKKGAYVTIPKLNATGVVMVIHFDKTYSYDIWSPDLAKMRTIKEKDLVEATKEERIRVSSLADCGITYISYRPEEKATVVKWDDGTMTVAVAKKGDKYNKEKGLLICIAKHHCPKIGNLLNSKKVK